ncbi:N-formylglutamate amidohydrolase [uncultured Jannaschia sp.]|uniref:N-formylglutamate amidohydrolase n=1 Tax=uncultured Jannaschia sp. TaxID=293347 RepID=UPI002606BAD8|nr:N-formylglutamate amidohydrolase [uncultured Jannaschia sp.]
MRDEWTAVEVIRPKGAGPAVLVCEHASARIPSELGDLGLSAASRHSHAAWDIGARDVALTMSALLDAPLVAGAISRLVYDCNRPETAPDAIPSLSERHPVPGNGSLDAGGRRDRRLRVHDPFHAALDAVLDARTDGPALVTVHSFTPVFHGLPRDVELGFLSHSDASLARAALAKVGPRHRSALDAPYGPGDGVTYTLARHGEARGLPALMIEIRNDLIDRPETAAQMGAHLAGMLLRSLDALDEAAA